MMSKLTVCAAAALSVFVGLQSAQAADYRLLASWDQNYPGRVVLLNSFMKTVEERTKGSVKFIVSGPETVPAFEQLQPAGAGVYQFLFTHGAYHFGTTPIGTAIEAIGGDLKERSAAGIKDAVDKHYQKFGLKLIAMPMSPMGLGYHLILKAPVGPSGDLTGRKIRATPTYAGVLKMLNASSLILPPAEIYTALEKGLADGAGWPTLGVLNYRWYEVSKHLLRPAFGSVSLLLFANLNTWNKLSEDDRKVLVEESAKIEEKWFNDFKSIAEAEERSLIEKGMTVTQMGDAQKGKLVEAWSAGQWENAAAKNPADTNALRELAKSKGLTP
jgi:TRAP-type C4-dicarboxylate transport system substrate-binding protein